MIGYPLKTMTLDEAKQMQFKIVDCATNFLSGCESLSAGDYGVKQGLNRPLRTSQVEQIIAQIFDAPACCLVRGAGTGALRYSLMATLPPNPVVLVHQAPIYPTSQVTLKMMKAKIVKVDFNDPDKVVRALQSRNFDAVLLQYTRQSLHDSYDPQVLIEIIKKTANMPIITDDNYAVLKVRKIGVQAGAALSTFSGFKILGPEGVGVIVGNKSLIEKIRQLNYSGGSQVQGPEAMALLSGMIYAPVSLAISGIECEELSRQLNGGIIEEIKMAFVSNAQSKVVIVQLKTLLASEVIKACEQFGAAPHPVGAESKYEFMPMIYRVSHTFAHSQTLNPDYLLRINPMRASAQTIIKILKRGIACLLSD